jgi:hypothetical protein
MDITGALAVTTTTTTYYALDVAEHKNRLYVNEHFRALASITRGCRLSVLGRGFGTPSQLALD